MANRISPDPLQRGSRWRRSFLNSFARFCGDTRGGIAVFAGIAFPIVIGGLGLGVETGYWHMTQRKLQHAADVAAHAAAVRNRAGDGYAGMETAAQYVASTSGYLADRGTLEMNVPPSSGDYVGNADAVEVILIENWGRWFTSLYADGQVPIGARAVALIESVGGPACILALSETASAGITVSGSTNVTLEGCSVASNSTSSSSFQMNGSGQLSADCVYSSGGANTTDGLTVPEGCPVVEAPPVRDPYRDVVEPAVEGPCENNNKVGQPNNTTTVEPDYYAHPSGVPSKRFCNGLDLKGQVNFEPGLYIIEGGDLTVNGGNLTSESIVQMIGEGVTFYITDTSRLKLNGNVEMQLSAPTEGPFAGILFFGARNATGVSHVINGSATSTLQGAIYTPASAIDFRGGSSSSGGCTQIIGDTVTLSGNSSIGSSCDTSGTSPALNETVRIVE